MVAEARGQAMTLRIDRLRANGWGPLRDVDVDLASLDGVTAICGVNGSGKSTLTESILGCLYRETPSRGALTRSATIKGATLELTGAIDGQAFLVRHVVDATTKTPRQESILRLGDAPPTSGKVKDFDAAAGAIFPPLALYLASAFAAQGGKGSFAGLSRDERRQVFARLLGLERLQAISDAAKDRRKEIELAIAILAGRIADASVGVPACLESELAKAHTVREADEQYLRDLEVQRARTAREVAECEAALKAVDHERDEWSKRRERKESLSILVGRAKQDIDRSQRAAVDAANLALQLVEAERLTGEAEALAPKASDLKAQVAAIVEQGKARRAELDSVKRDLSDLYTILHRADEIRAAAARVDDLSVSMGQYTIAVTDAETSLHEAREDADAARRIEADVRRLTEQHTQALASVGALGRVPCGGDGAYGSCPLITQAVQARDTIEGIAQELADAYGHLDPNAQSRLDAATLHHREVKDQLARLRVDLDTARAKAADVGRLDDAEARSKDLDGKVAVLEAELAPLRDQHAALDADLREVTTKIALLGKELSVKCPAGVRVTQERAATAKAEADLLDERRQRLGGYRADLDVLGDLGPEPSVYAAQGKVKSATIDAGGVAREIVDVQRRRDDTLKRVATLEAQAEQARAGAEQRGKLEAEHARLLQDAADWDLVERGFGKAGIQALLVDAAGPAISTLCNRLLEVTFGSRFRVSLETTRLDSTGKKLIEDLDLRVIDNEGGHEGPMDEFSGGEMVVLSMALRLAFCLHSGSQIGDPIFMDEADGALDAGNAARFVPVMREAMRIGGVPRIVFITHRESAAAMADHVIDVADGKVRVER
jgi:exonuclease SbcC